jgi:hypothetical protein
MHNTIQIEAASARAMNSHAVALLIGALVSPFLVGCGGPGKIERGIVKEIRRCPQAKVCQVSIQAVTDFDWSMMYAFDLNSDAKDRERILGVKDEGFQELTRQLVFLRHGKIVHQENEPTNFEGPIRNDVVFDHPDDATYVSYPHDALFSVEEGQAQTGPYFVLKRIPSEK